MRLSLSIKFIKDVLHRIMKENRAIKMPVIIGHLGLLVNLTFFVLYLAYTNVFAKLHVQFSFLSFPIFVGEFLLLFNFVVFILCLCFSKNLVLNKFNICVFLFITFVLMHALVGFNNWGILAFRHAQMFNYALFSVFTYTFLSPYSNKQWQNIFIYMLAVFLMFCGNTNWMFVYFILALLSTKNISNRKIKYALLIILLIITPYTRFIYTARMIIVANMASLLLISISLVAMWRAKILYKIFVSLAAIGCIIGVFCFNYETLETIFNYNKLKNRFIHQDKIVQKHQQLEMQKTKKWQHDFGINLYNAKKIKKVKTKEVNHQQPNTSVEQSRNNLIDHDQLKRNVKNLYLNKDSKTSMVNIMFRLFIWRDLIRELVSERAIFGFGFGKPTRSKSIEILGWGDSEWKRDGWIAVHNSYLHIIYRIGVVGVVFLLLLAFHLLKAICFFVKTQNLNGILLCSMVINWFVAANFLLIFEVPYTAIPMWCIVGVTAHYYDVCRKRYTEQIA